MRFLPPCASARLGYPLDRAQPGVPAARDFGHRADRDVEVHGPHGVADLTAGSLAIDQPRAVEDGQMFGHRLPREGELGGELSWRDLAVGEDQVEDAAPRRVGD